MSGVVLPPTDTVGVHCKGTDLHRDDVGIPTGIHRTAFRVDDDGASSAWVQHIHHGVVEDHISRTIECISKNLKPTKTHRLALFAVEAIEGCGLKFELPLSVVHAPDPGFVCHSLIVGIDPESTELLDTLCLELLSLEAILV